MEIGKPTKKVMGWIIIGLIVIGFIAGMVWAWGLPLVLLIIIVIIVGIGGAFLLSTATDWIKGE